MTTRRPPQDGARPGCTQRPLGQGEVCAWALPRGLQKQGQLNTPANRVVCTELGVGGGKGTPVPAWLPRAAPTLSPPGGAGCPSIAWAGRSQPPGEAWSRPASPWPSAGRSFRTTSQGLQIQPFSRSANLMIPISFKTHTFPPAPACSAKREGWSALGAHRGRCEARQVLRPGRCTHGSGPEPW